MPGAPPLGKDGAHHAEAIAAGAQVTDAMNPRMLEARNLGDGEPRPGDAYMNEGLNLKPVAPEPSVIPGRRRRRGIQAQNWHVLPPEDIESVTEIRIAPVEARVEEGGQRAVADASQPRDVTAAAPQGEPGSLGEVGPVQQRCHEPRDLAGVGRA